MLYAFLNNFLCFTLVFRDDERAASGRAKKHTRTRTLQAGVYTHVQENTYMGLGFGLKFDNPPNRNIKRIYSLWKIVLDAVIATPQAHMENK